MIPWTVSHRLLCSWNSSGKKSGVGSHSLLQGIFPVQGMNSGLPHCRQILYCLRHQGSPYVRLETSTQFFFKLSFVKFIKDFPGASDSKESACNPGYWCSIPGLRRSPEEGNGNLLQYSCLENSIDRGAWWATVHGVANSWT